MKLYLLHSWIFGCLLALLVGCMNAGPGCCQDGKSVVEELVTLFTAWSGVARPEVVAECATHIDYAGMAQEALGKAGWNSLKAVQKDEFVRAFRHLVERRYYPRWHKLFYQGRLIYNGESKVNQTVYVKTTLKVGRKEESVVWCLRPLNGKLSVVNMDVDDKSLVGRLGSRLRRQQKRGGARRLVEWLKDKMADADAADGAR